MSKLIASALRKQLEDANYKLPFEKFKELEALHISLLPSVPSPSPVFYRDEKILSSFSRIVTGAHGPYVEFSTNDALVPMEITRGEEWRTLEKYKYTKYLHLNFIGFPELKIYKQKHRVKYADYVPGLYYIDFYEVNF
jgi:hypothetical protein